jgi:hypothetical protein
MGLVSDFLTAEWIDAQIRQWHCEPRDLVSPRSLATWLRKRQNDEITAENLWAEEIKKCAERVELAHLTDVPAKKVRKFCLDFTQRGIKTVASLDFSEEHIRKEEGVCISDAKKYVARYGGRWWRVGHYAGIEYTKMRQPCDWAFGTAQCLAAIAGDRDLAKRLVQAYELAPEPPETAEGPRVRNLLYHATGGNDELLKRIEPRLATLAKKVVKANRKYHAPGLSQFPLSVIRGDEKGLVEAVRKTTKMFQGIWDKRKYPPDPADPYKNWGNRLADWKRHLVREGWVISWWGLAWLNIARWRGMTKVFSDPDNFSEFVPLSLCEAPGTRTKS